jgi:hypothetical protein
MRKSELKVGEEYAATLRSTRNRPGRYDTVLHVRLLEVDHTYTVQHAVGFGRDNTRKVEKKGMLVELLEPATLGYRQDVAPAGRKLHLRDGGCFWQDWPTWARLREEAEQSERERQAKLRAAVELADNVCDRLDQQKIEYDRRQGRTGVTVVMDVEQVHRLLATTKGD